MRKRDKENYIAPSFCPPAAVVEDLPLPAEVISRKHIFVQNLYSTIIAYLLQFEKTSKKLQCK
jgi:hypothetical protein